MYLSLSQSRSVVSDSATPWTIPHQAPCPWNSPGKNTGMGSHSFLQGIFPTQGSNLVSYIVADSLPSEPPGKPKYMYT